MRESTLEEDILPLMSAPPLGGISLTFTVCWTAASLFSTLFPLFSFLPVHSFSFFIHYPVGFPFAPCESHALVFAVSAVVAVCSHTCCTRARSICTSINTCCFPVCSANKPGSESRAFFSSMLGRTEWVTLPRTEPG